MRPFHMREALLSPISTGLISMRPNSSTLPVIFSIPSGISGCCPEFFRTKRFLPPGAGSEIRPIPCNLSKAVRQLISLMLPLGARQSSQPQTRRERDRREIEGSCSTGSMIRAITSSLNSFPHAYIHHLYHVLPTVFSKIAGHAQGSVRGSKKPFITIWDKNPISRRQLCL